ncbi:MAG: aldehyde ferredoxin oxidoreductase family protein, partial [Dehalococcoidia bacterium]|nr:aldehyde ferredoxin oxidoreductase family protein [Dehalococcoidia bacterium]
MGTYMPKLLRVDLSSGSAQDDTVPEDVARQFVGARGFGIKYLFDELAPGIDPLGPENKLLLLAGPLAGTSAQSLSRWMVVTKSPLTGTCSRSVGGADFGAWLRFAGFDLIIIEGRAEKPVYLYIEEGRAQVLDAGALWGLDTWRCQEKLKETHGPATRIACIGPAGEKLVRYAGVFSDRRAAARGGSGAVMGSKSLKAVAIKASRQVSLAEPKAFKRLVQEQIQNYKNGPMFAEFSAAGTTSTVEAANGMGIYPTRNFRLGQMKDFQRVSAEEYAKVTEKHVGCYSCMVNCVKVRKVPSGPYAGIATEGPEYETIWAFTGPIDSAALDVTVAADCLCDDLGLDTISTGNVVGFAYELFERGIITAHDTDGLELVYGNPEPVMDLIPKIARREGFGDVLAEGVARAAASIGRGAEAYAMHVKGLEMPGYDPRGAKAHGLSYATASRGADHNYGYSMQELFNIPIPRPVNRLADEGKGDIAKFNQDFAATIELANLCMFPPGLGWTTLGHLGKLLAAATGVKEFADVGYLWAAGERVYNLERLFNVREGFTRDHDTLPRRMLTEPLEAGPIKGETVRKLDTLLDEYY